MKLHFTGDVQALLSGIAALSGDLGFALSDSGMEVAVRQVDGAPLTVSLADGRAEIGFDKRIHFFRALSLLCQHMAAGETAFSLSEVPQFTMNGPMYDVSQGGAVIRVSEIKKLLRQMAQMGLNMLMLYCEDSFDVKPQPYFGYMRPRYSEADIRECDDYADALGIEMIPCIQTLAHLVDVLKWNGVYHDITENDVCLLVGEEKTYDFIRDLLTEATRPFRSRRVHIGMDEAYNLGRGPYLTRNGLVPVAEIMQQHLTRVLAITRELGLEPMMWSDMFFHGYGYRKKEPLPQSVYDCCPEGVQLVYWDYDARPEEDFSYFINRHRPFGEPIFAGGIWTWLGFGAHWDFTFRHTERALNACKKEGIREVFVTIWGDNGTECLYTANILGLALWAEHGYAEKIDYDKLRARFEFVTGAKYDDFLALEGIDGVPGAPEGSSSCNPSKYLMWQDILTGLLDKNIDGLPLDAHYAALAEKLDPMRTRNGAYNSLFEFSWHAARVLALKSEMGLRITRAYKAGDRETLRRIAEEDLPELKSRMKALQECHRAIWFRLYKALGWDIMDMRYGSLLSRIDSAAVEIGQYLSGELDRIEELEEKRLDYNGKPGLPNWLNWFGRVVSASRIAPYC